MSSLKYQISIFSILVLMILAFILFAPEVFLNSRIYISYLSIIPFTMLLSLALMPLIIAKEIDLSFPSIVGLCGFVFTKIYLLSGSITLGVFASLLCGLVAGFINAFIVIIVGVPSIIATIGSQFLFYGLAMILSNGLAINVIALQDTSMGYFLVGKWFDFLPAQSFWVICYALILYFMLFHHKIGNAVLFMGDNERATKMMGIETKKVKIFLFLQLGLVSAFCSILLAFEMGNWWPSSASGYLLIVFASIFIGGTSVFGGEGSVFGTVIGSVIIGIIESGTIALGLDGFYTRFMYGVIIIVSVSIYATILKRDKYA